MAPAGSANVQRASPAAGFLGVPTPLTPITTPRGACCPAIRVVQVADQEGGWRNGRGGRTVPRGRGRAGGHGRAARAPRSLRLRPLPLAHFQVPGARQAFCGPLRRPDRLSGAGCRRTRRAARCRPWAEGLALAGVVASWARCSLQQERTPAPGGDGSAVPELGLAGRGGVGRAPEPRSRRVFPGLEGRLGLASAPGDATRPSASWNRGQGRAALGAVKSGCVW